MDGTIAAVVVTYNRLGCLQENIVALRAQTHKLDEIIVVDNDSTDGTATWLKDQVDLTVIHQVNSGSGGGQHTGIKTANERGHTWIWCMDDDGYPVPNALEKLCAAVASFPAGRVFNALPIDKDDHSKLCFYQWSRETGKRYYTLDELMAETSSNLLDGIGALFLGTLIHRDVVAAVGLPMAKLFIRGDEGDYLVRIHGHGFRIYTVLDSYFYHPNQRRVSVRFLGRVSDDEPMADWKRYYSIRNAIFMERRYRGNASSHVLALRVVRIVLFHSIVQLRNHKTLQQKIRSLRQVILAMTEGLRMTADA